MWHEARKQEKMIRGMIVDYRRRAERRKDFYEKNKADPTQFLQLHGRPCKIHLDPAVAAAGEGPAIMMPWQGDPNNMIDRFDVRAHLDYIPEVKTPYIPPEELSSEERQCNYERYRILAQNAFLGMSEDKFLQQLAIEEQFGVTLEEKEMAKEKLNEKKGTGAAIGYNYSDPTAQPSTSIGPDKKVEAKDSDDDSELEILDVDLSIDVNKMEASQAHELNAVGPQFGMAGCDLFSFLTGDADDAEHQKQLLREEKEKAMFSGRKSRRERRAHRDKKLATRVVSPPSYAAPATATAGLGPSPRSPPAPSRTPSPADDAPPTIQFITSFGGDDDEVKPAILTSKTLYSEKVKHNLKKSYSEIARKKARSPELNYSRPIGPRGPNSRSISRSKSKSMSRSRSRSRSRLRSGSRSRSRSPSRSRSRSRSISRNSRSRSRSYRKSRSTSRSRSKSRSRSRSRSYDSCKRSSSRSRSMSRNYGRRSRSISNSASAKRNKSRSMSFESNDRTASKSAVAVPRYYGRRKEDKSSSELSLDSDTSGSEDMQNKSSLGNKSNTNVNPIRSSRSSSKGMSRETMSLKEKLKRKMQAQLSRQLRLDKRAEAERVERESRRQARRDHEMRELAIKLRRKQREMRHKYRRSSDESDRSRSRSSSRESASGERQSRSRSPEADRQNRPERPDRPPVWERDHWACHKPGDRQGDRPSDRPGNDSSRSPTEEKRPPVWDREPYRHDQPPPPPHYDYRRKYDEGRPDNRNADYRNDNPRFRNERYENQYENRLDSRRPYGHRGGFRGQGRPDWKDDRDDGRGKVKLVDY